MEITIYSIIAVTTSVITFIFGVLSKKFNLVEKTYIPLQNLAIGLMAGVLCFVLKVDGMDLITSLVVCLSSALGAGGAYDLAKTGK